MAPKNIFDYVDYNHRMGSHRKARILNPLIAIRIIDESGNEIGYITSIAPSARRTVDRRRHLSATTAGQVIELTYGPEDIDLTVEGFTLYYLDPTAQQDTYVPRTGNLIDRLIGENVPAGPLSAQQIFTILNRQHIPFDIWEEICDNPTIGQKIIRRIYKDCLIRSWSGTYNTTNYVVAERVEVTVSAWSMETIDGNCWQQ